MKMNKTTLEEVRPATPFGNAEPRMRMPTHPDVTVASGRDQ